MRFGFTSEQLEVADVVGRVLSDHCPPSYAREKKGAGAAGEVWQALGSTGILGFGVPETHGGLGATTGLVDLVLPFEEAGRAALPEPFAETAGICVPLLVAAGTEDLRNRWLPRIANGDAQATVCLTPRAPAPGARDADLIIGLWDGAIHVVPNENTEMRRETSIDFTRRYFHVVPETSSATILSSSAVIVERAQALQMSAFAAILNGISRRLLQMTVAYVKEREQFGRPVGSFQAVKHQLADIYVELELSRSANWYAAYALQRGASDVQEAVLSSMLSAISAHELANRVSLQCHGAIGFTWEHDLHIWLKRGKAVTQTGTTQRELSPRLWERLVG